MDGSPEETVTTVHPPIDEHGKEQSKRTIPVARVKKLMKMHRENTRLTEDSVMLMTAATELFIQELAKACCEQAATVNEHSMVYHHLAKVVQTDSRLGFLQEYVPMKMNVRDLIQQAKDTLRNGENSKKD